MTEINAVEILIVEDTPQDLELTLRALRKAKLSNRIHVARDGAEALEFIFCEGQYNNRKIENGPKVILLDLKLPKIDGIEVLRRIKSDPRTQNHPSSRADIFQGAERRRGKLSAGSQQLHRQAGELRTRSPQPCRSWACIGCCSINRPASKSNMTQPLRVLIVEDNADDAELMLRELRRAGFEPDCNLRRYGTGLSGQSSLGSRTDPFRLFDAPVQRIARAGVTKEQSGLDIPFILVSATIGEDTAVAAMRSGAADYLLKDRLARLGQAVEHALDEKRLHERRQAEECDAV